MKSIKFNVGDIINIPLKNKQNCSGVVLFKSKKFKKVILLGLILEPVATGDDLEKHIKALVYTGDASIKEGHWTIEGSIDVPNSKLFTERLDGSSVWLLDDKLRPASPNDRTLLPVMRVAGEGLVESLANQLSGLEDFSKFTELTVKKTKALLEKIING